MSKAKLDPKYAKASKLAGLTKAEYLARGDLDETANGLVLNIKHSYWAHIREAKRKDASRAYMAYLDKEIQSYARFMVMAVLASDDSLFRDIADVLKQHKDLNESVVGDYIERKPANKLAHDMTCWSIDHPNGTFAQFWAWLERSPDWPAYRNLRTASKLKSAQTAVRNVAKQIGITFAADTKGPRRG